MVDGNSYIDKKDDLLSELKDIEGVIYTKTPGACVDWNTGEISYRGESVGSKFEAFTVRSIKLDPVEKAVEFVKRNKQNIIVYSLDRIHWSDEARLAMPIFPTSIFLRYSKRPGAELI